jgi:hypothetical protein
MPGKWFDSFLLKHLVLVAKHENARNLSKVFLKHAPQFYLKYAPSAFNLDQ